VHPHSTSKLLDLKDCIINKIDHSDSFIRVTISTKAKKARCPACGKLTSKIHDYRLQTIKDLPLMSKNTLLILRKRRYACSCGKRFFESYDFLPRYSRMTNRLVAFIINELRNCIPISMVSDKVNLSTHTITRVFDFVQYGKPSSLPKVLAIDEFRGNAGGEKFQCILVDPKKRTVLDILADRKQNHLIDYFKSYSRHERLKVQYFVCDMWAPYADLAKAFFPNASVIVDKYHFIRQIAWALENVRKRIQKSMTSSLKKYFKRSRRLLLKRSDKLKPHEKEALDVMLLYSEDLRQAYRLKEAFYDICKEPKYSVQRVDFYAWLKYAEQINLPEFEACITTFRNWSKEILNAFKYGYTNGCTEGFNNRIKVIKRISYGVKNFQRFRNRILHICS
jgi:transposase